MDAKREVKRVGREREEAERQRERGERERKGENEGKGKAKKTKEDERDGCKPVFTSNFPIFHTAKLCRTSG